ncbi:unnamed protein product [Closterium sp. Yama58-4]|nr:unnamed protein product [Closterium sp. Yama58-4]
MPGDYSPVSLAIMKGAVHHHTSAASSYAASLSEARRRQLLGMSWAGLPFLPGTSSLVEELDKKLLVVLRDGRKIIGILRSFDQFANLVLERTTERIVVGEQYCDLPLGLYIIRGENVVLIGTLDEHMPEMPPNMVSVSLQQIRQAQKEEKEASELKGMLRKQMDFLDIE